VFRYVTNLQINKSWETLTDTAVIEMPGKLKNEQSFLKDLIRVNDAVTIKLGYFPNLVTRFTGYVSSIVPGSPLKIRCEDESFKLKQQFLESYSKKPVTLETLIKDNYTGEVNVADADLGGFSIDKGATLIQVIQKIRTDYKLFGWFRNGVLNIGLPYIKIGGIKNFKFQRNIIDGDNLISTEAGDLQTIAYGISILSDGTKIELYTYYENGIIKTSEINPGGNLNRYSTKGLSKKKLAVILERWLPNLYYTGFKGSFTTFGEPVVDHGDIAEITDLKYPEKNGKYLIKAVSINFGVDGYRQTVELERKIN